MSHLFNSKVGKLLVVLPILISSLLISTVANSQKTSKKIDSVSLKREIDAVLAKYGLKSKGFAINVVSLNQKGGQTAYLITNNYYNKQPELADSNKVAILKEIERLREQDETISNRVMIALANGSNAGKFAQQLQAYLTNKGYDLTHTLIGTVPTPQDGYRVFAMPCTDNVTICIVITIGYLESIEKPH